MVRKKAENTEGFVKRLNQACDDAYDIIPPHGEGRQIELAKRMQMSQEGVRKWFAGESMPRRGVMSKLSNVLRVEETWLALGATAEITSDEKRVRARNAQGAALLAMGAITLAGGVCAIPDDDDPRSSFVDFYYIHHGVQAAVHATHAKQISPGLYEATIPREYRQVRILVVIPVGNNRFDFIRLDSVNDPQVYQRKAGAFIINFGKTPDGYASGVLSWKRIKNFGELA